MKKSILTILLLYMGVISACSTKSSNEEANWLYRPMIYIQNEMYGETGKGVDSLPEEAVLLGRIEKIVSQIEPMVKENLTANTDLEGMEVFGEEKDKKTVYIQVKESTRFHIYTTMEEPE